MKPDYRRETQELLKNKNITSGIVMSQIGVSHNTYYRWKRGESSPTRADFERLKQLALGQMSGTVSAMQHGQGGTDEMQMDVLERLARIRKTKTGIPRIIPLHPKIQRFPPFRGWNRDRVERAFGRAVKRARLGRVRFHDLRHTFCSNYLQSGGTVMDLQKISGHRTIQSLQIYTHFQKDFLQERIANYELK